MGTIRDEIRQTRPFPSATEEAVVTLVATADRVRSALDRVAEAHGITLQQYNVLRILRGAGEPGLPTLDVAARMIDRSPGITRLVERLEKRRLVKRARCAEDRRQVLCRATPRGLELLGALDGPMADGARRCLAPLDEAHTRELVDALDRVRAAAAVACTGPNPTRTEDGHERKKETRR